MEAMIIRGAKAIDWAEWHNQALHRAATLVGGITTVTPEEACRIVKEEGAELVYTEVYLPTHEPGVLRHEDIGKIADPETRTRAAKTIEVLERAHARLEKLVREWSRP